MPGPQTGQTHSDNLSAFVEDLFECVWPFCGAGAKGVKDVNIKFFLDKFHFDALLSCFFTRPIVTFDWNLCYSIIPKL